MNLSRGRNNQTSLVRRAALSTQALSFKRERERARELYRHWQGQAEMETRGKGQIRGACCWKKGVKKDGRRKEGNIQRQRAS